MELVREENLFETDKLKSGVKPLIRCIGAEIIDFLVFRNKFLKENLTVKLWRKME